MEKGRAYERIVDEHRRTLALKLPRGGLALFSTIYGWAVSLRLWLYRQGWLRTYRPDVPVVSVGNITLGGSGKTPVVQYLARWLRERGKQVAVLSRGYKREGRGVEVVSDGAAVLVDWPRAGDEPFLLAANLPGVPIVVGENRTAAAKLAFQLFTPEVFILDDGFQHLRMGRHLDVVAIDGTSPFGNGRLFPRGKLREPLSSLRRADVLWITRVDQAEDLDGLKEELKKTHPHGLVVESIYRPHSLRSIDGQDELPLEVLKGRKVIALSGIGSPHSFEVTLTHLGASVVEVVRFPDHYRYVDKDLVEVFALARKRGVEILVTTEKDYVRLPRERLNSQLLTYYLKVEVEVVKGLEGFEHLLWSRLGWG